MLLQHQNINLVTKQPFWLMIIGVKMLVVAIVGGFGLGPKGWEVESFLGSMVAIDPAVTSRGSFVFERWLLVAVLVTALFTFIYWIIFSIFLSKRFHEAVVISDIRIGAEKAFLQSIGPIALIVILIVFWMMRGYLINSANSSYLKYATFVLLASYVVYDFCFMFLGKIHPHSSVAIDMATEGRETLLRLDAPMLIGFIILFIFTDYITHAEMTQQHKYLIYAFGAGAAAFKLILTVLVFTIINYEKLCVTRTHDGGPPL
jgi:hypothetical protein